MHPPGSDWHLHGGAPPYPAAPSLESAASASLDPTSLLAPPRHDEGVVWVDAPPPQPHPATFSHHYSLDGPLHHRHPPRLAYDPAADEIQAHRDSAQAQQHAHHHQYQPYLQQHYAPPRHAPPHADPHQHPPPQTAYSPPDVKRRRISHDQYFEQGLVDQHPAPPGWHDAYEHHELDAAFSPQPTGTAPRRPSDGAASSRRDSAQLLESEVVARHRASWGVDAVTAAADLRLSPHLASSASPSLSLLPAPSGPAPDGMASSDPTSTSLAQPLVGTASAPGPGAPLKPTRARLPRDDAGQAGLADKSCKQCRCVHSLSILAPRASPATTTTTLMPTSQQDPQGAVHEDLARLRQVHEQEPAVPLRQPRSEYVHLLLSSSPPRL